MAPIPSTLISSGSNKEPKCVCLSEGKASHSHEMWTEVSSSVPHLLHMGSLLNPIIYRCLRKVLCPASRPVTTLDCILLKDNNRAPAAIPRPDISSRASLCVLQGTRQMLFLHPAFHLSSHNLPRDPKEGLRSNKPMNRSTPCKLVGDFISSHSGMPRDRI